MFDFGKHTYFKKTFGILFDFTILFLVYIFLIRNFYFFPFTSIFSTFIFSGIICFYFLISYIFFKKSFGLKFLSLESPLLKSVFLFYLLTSFFTIPYLYYGMIVKNPLTQNSLVQDLSAIDIEKLSKKEQTEWYFLPFFYTSGLWPKQLSEDPITYFLPYKKGPPDQFPSEVQIKLNNTHHVTMTVEGPKTPTLSTSIENLRLCFENIQTHSQCFQTKINLLTPHLQAMKEITHTHFFPTVKIEWFKVHNLKLIENERPEGFYIKAQDKKWIIEKYVLINPKGTQQSISLIQQNSDASEYYSSLLKKTVQSQRVHTQLLENKNLINFQLSRVQTKKLNQTSFSKETLNEHLSILTQLIAKISVDPSQFDAYFHLGGHTYLITEYLLQSMNREPAEDSLSALKLFYQEWSSTSQKMIQSSLKYAQDIAPNDSRMIQLEKLLISAQKKALNK